MPNTCPRIWVTALGGRAHGHELQGYLGAHGPKLGADGPKLRFMDKDLAIPWLSGPNEFGLSSHLWPSPRGEAGQGHWRRGRRASRRLFRGKQHPHSNIACARSLCLSAHRSVDFLFHSVGKANEKVLRRNSVLRSTISRKFVRSRVRLGLRNLKNKKNRRGSQRLSKKGHMMAR